MGIIQLQRRTANGRIAGLTTSLEKGETPIRREIRYFIKFITIIALLTGISFFILCMCYNHDFFSSFSYFIALVIANVPEGLPVTLTACMTLTSKRMATKNCLVKKLEAIETLGCCNVICSDKTGTLTQNKMKMVHLYYDAQAYYVMVDVFGLDQESKAFEALTLCATLCSRASFVIGQEYVNPDDRDALGDASEQAILKGMEFILREKRQQLKRDYPKVCEIPFNSSNKYQVSIHKIKGRPSHLLVMKGAPERLLERCTSILRFEETQTLSLDIKKNIKRSVNNLGLRGERVLAFADSYLSATYNGNYNFQPEPPNFPLSDLRFVGLISMMDPPRPSVPDAVAKCKTAGIRVIMVTGDHPLTAAAIAKQVGILSHNSVNAYDIALRRDISVSMVTEKERMMCNAAVITGSDLREMNEMELQKCLVKFHEIVFARTSPQQKLKIVEAFQNLKKVVAVTGDGVNDSPALKKADIGIAMGIAGTEVSKDAADMILLDDNFSSIVTGIEEGRLIFDNLKKSIAYLLTSNIPEIVPFIFSVAFKYPPILSVLAVLIIDVGLGENWLEEGNTTEIIIHDSYGNEWTRSERSILTKKCYSAFFLSIVITQVADLLICKTRRLSLFQQGMTNWVLNVGVFIEVAIAALAVFCPGVRTLLRFEPIHLDALLPAIPFAIIIVVYDELRKLCIRKYPHGVIYKETYY